MRGVHITLRMRLFCEVFRDGKPMEGQQYEVLNEVVVDRGANPYLTKIECYEQGRLITKVSCCIAVDFASKHVCFPASGNFSITASVISIQCECYLCFCGVLQLCQSHKKNKRRVSVIVRSMSQKAKTALALIVKDLDYCLCPGVACGRYAASTSQLGL